MSDLLHAFEQCGHHIQPWPSELCPLIRSTRNQLKPITAYDAERWIPEPIGHISPCSFHPDLPWAIMKTLGIQIQPFHQFVQKDFVAHHICENELATHMVRERTREYKVVTPALGLKEPRKVPYPISIIH